MHRAACSRRLALLAYLATSDGVDCAARATGEPARVLGIDAVATVLCTPGSHRLSEANLRLAQGKTPLTGAELRTLQAMVGADDALTVPLQAIAGITGSVPASDRHWEGTCFKGHWRTRRSLVSAAGTASESSPLHRPACALSQELK